MNRSLHNNEKIVIAALMQAAGVESENLDSIKVNVINPETGTIRSAQLARTERTKAVADCNFNDSDGVYVEVILFMNMKGHFGELYVWKVNDTPLIRFPECLDQIRNIRSISGSYRNE